MRLRIQTTASHQALDITALVTDALAEGGPGLALVHTQHTTVALVIGPSDDAMLRDFERVGRQWLADCGPFEHLEHDNANGEAHLLSAYGGTRLLLPLDAGGVRLGTWQRILLLELDGPRDRAIEVDRYLLTPAGS